ncbi:hypothetical protein BDN70DRAFT_489527 [Pholiota conissans]|uniref:Uncharacterized protein n=1 Tax=Pholiota conissans TaxID=109636 RepID=A0A9P6CSQ3_9AGAR|nr:hypothetical protein BDN70DRAFT_489527 [Pholiota conissans]
MLGSSGDFSIRLDAEDWATCTRRRSRVMPTLRLGPTIFPSLVGKRRSPRLPMSTPPDAVQATSTLPCAIEVACVLPPGKTHFHLNSQIRSSLFDEQSEPQTSSPSQPFIVFQ